jgi:hypothetical protein
MRRTWLRPTWMPSAWAARARASRVQCAGAWGWAGGSSPSPPCCRRPGGSVRASWMIRPRSSSVSRRGTPGRGRSASPCSPWVWLKRCSHLQTVLGWQPDDWASSATLAPSQLAVMMRARWIRLAGACRALASLRRARSSAASVGVGRTAAAWPCGPPRPPGGATTNTRRTGKTIPHLRNAALAHGGARGLLQESGRRPSCARPSREEGETVGCQQVASSRNLRQLTRGHAVPKHIPGELG